MEELGPIKDNLKYADSLFSYVPCLTDPETYEHILNIFVNISYPFYWCKFQLRRSYSKTFQWKFGISPWGTPYISYPNSY